MDINFNKARRTRTPLSLGITNEENKRSMRNFIFIYLYEYDTYGYKSIYIYFYVNWRMLKRPTTF